MKIEFDPAKREWTLRTRGLVFAEAGRIFDQFALTVEDARKDYGEIRFMTHPRRRSGCMRLESARRSAPPHKPQKGKKK